MKRFIVLLAMVLGVSAMVRAQAPPPLLRTPNTTNIASSFRPTTKFLLGTMRTTDGITSCLPERVLETL